MNRALFDQVAGELIATYGCESSDQPQQVLFNSPSMRRVVEAKDLLLDVVIPGKFSAAEGGNCLGSKEVLSETLIHIWELLLPEVAKSIVFRWQGAAAQEEGNNIAGQPETTAVELLETLFGSLVDIRKLLVEDIQATYRGDPAALTYAEVKLAYPGLEAIATHRIAHCLYRANLPIIPRIMSESAHRNTGADIHPGAQIGRGFFIDHATGVVIGETAIIGDHVKVYQGVTIGAKSFPLDRNGHPIKHIKRHPTVGNHVIIYANATILGGDTLIADHTTIAGNLFITSTPSSQRAC